jgi:hypothetical protein
MFKGANGPLNGGGPACVVAVSVDIAATAIGDDPVAGAARVTAPTPGLDVVFDNRIALGDCSVDTLILELSCSIDDVAASDDALRDDVFDTPSTTAVSGAVCETLRVEA